tara:strand:- start:1223 stop:2002 length:780 start_codon:yes stop_codon:yes gene_type:complete
MDRLTTLEVTHVLNATEDVSNFFEGSSHLSYLRCPIKVRASPRMPMPPSVASWCRRRIAPRAFASHDRVPFDKRQDRSDAAAEMAAHFPAAVEFINSAREANGEHCSRALGASPGTSRHTSPPHGRPARPAAAGRALVHCRAGVSRSATVVIGYLMTTCKWDLKTALHHVDTKRFVQPNSGFINFLIGLERKLFGAASPPWPCAPLAATASVRTQLPHQAPALCPPGTTSCTAADFGYAAEGGDGSLPIGMPPPTPMRR